MTWDSWYHRTRCAECGPRPCLHCQQCGRACPLRRYRTDLLCSAECVTSWWAHEILLGNQWIARRPSPGQKALWTRALKGPIAQHLRVAHVEWAR